MKDEFNNLVGQRTGFSDSELCSPVTADFAVY